MTYVIIGAATAVLLLLCLLGKLALNSRKAKATKKAAAYPGVSAAVVSAVEVQIDTDTAADDKKDEVEDQI